MRRETPDRDESGRLDSLRSLGILDTAPEARFDRITRVAHQTFGFEVAAVTFIDSDRQWFKSCVGFEVTERPREDTFCTHTIEGDDVLVVEDAALDERFSELTIVAGPPFVRSYVGAPVKGPDGSRVGTLCVIGVTPRQVSESEVETLRDLASWVEDELRNDRERLNRLFDQSSVAMLEFDVRRLVSDLDDDTHPTTPTTGLSHLMSLIDYNAPAVSALAGVVDPEAKDEVVSRFEAHEALGNLMDQIVASIASSDIAQSSMVVIADGEGVVRTFDASWSLHRPLGPSGPVTLSLLLADVSEQHAAYEQMAVLVAAKDRLIASVSHEIRTPLTGILGFAHELESVLQRGDTDLAVEFSRAVLDQSEEMSYIVEDLLALARTDGGNHLVILPEPLHVAVEATEVVHKLGLDVDVASSEVSVIADRVRTRQVLRNLLTNADRYGGATVRVDIERRRDRVEIRVVDDGDGIPDDRLPLIFEPYERLGGHQELPGSIGIGLAVARNLAEAMDGSLDYQRANDETVFLLDLPAASPRGANLDGRSAPPPSLLHSGTDSDR